jgi:hypothetical protein
VNLDDAAPEINDCICELRNAPCYLTRASLLLPPPDHDPLSHTHTKREHRSEMEEEERNKRGIYHACSCKWDVKADG